MIHYENISLAPYTTFKMGGICKHLWEPENTDELLLLLKHIEQPYRIISGGSNLLINDDKVFENVILLKSFNSKFEFLEDGKFVVGASVRLQKLIKGINDLSYGGIEYLYSVPGLVGGAVAMNAGRGITFNQSISDYILEVVCYLGGEVVRLRKEECDFSFRDSKFKTNDIIILEVVFKFKYGNTLEFEDLRKERIELVKNLQDNSKPNFGTVFCDSNSYIMKFIRKFPGKNKIHYSTKTANWLLNDGGSYNDAIVAIERVKRIHRILGLKCKQEVVQWD